MAFLKPRTPKTGEVRVSTKPSTTKAVIKKAVVTSGGQSLAKHAGVLLRPHVSERASDTAAHGIYVFRVALRATKPQIKAAVVAMYKVTVDQVRTVTIHPKKITVKGKPGVRKSGRKAYVYDKKGDTIEVI